MFLQEPDARGFGAVRLHLQLSMVRADIYNSFPEQNRFGELSTCLSW